MQLNQIIELAHEYARCRVRLISRCAFIQEAINRIKRAQMPIMRAHSSAVASAYDALARAIDSSRELFNSPKTMTVDDVKFGLRKQKGKLNWQDEEEVIHRIKIYYPDTFKDLLHIKETPDKKALEKLPASELKKLGVTLTEDFETVIISTPENESEKLAAAFISEE